MTAEARNAHDKPWSPPAPRRYIPQTRGKRIACAAVVAIILAAVTMAIVLVATAQTPNVSAMSFSNTGGTWSLRESSNSSEPVAELSGYAQVLLRSTNPNSYTVDMNNVKIAVYASAPPVPSNQVASGPWPAAMSWLEVPGGNKWTETTRPIKVAWQLTGTESARVLAKGLLDCGIAAEKLPSHLVAQAASKGNDESQTLVTVRTRARKVVGVFGVRVATDSEWTSKLPASSLLCPDPAVLTSRANLERLSTLLNDAWHVKKD